MQEWRDDEVVSSEPLLDDINKIRDKMFESLQKMQDGQIDHVRIGRIPEVNEAIEVNGLRFVVIAASNDGEFTATLNDPRVLGKDGNPK